ncbi:hypothetical protein [Acidianus sp. RZ1]|uniref:hypothetical protein n=1 Tax=Acidianus sp. RZ1 TaxID=1540082 RepID=UPI001490F8F1|nr:hypothetical protein [Acidianus sp. RZ1]NON62352.1 hypothetical protein [Acidianus sp. RZ1]
MESYIKDPSPEEAKKLIESINRNKEICISTPYDPDAMMFSALILKYMESQAGVSFSSTDCEVTVAITPQGRTIKYNNSEVFIGQSALTSVLPFTAEDILPILAGIGSSVFLERRRLTEWEISMLKKAENLGITIEKNFRIPSYKELPLFLSLMESIDLFIPEITGNRDNAIRAVKELGVDELTKLEELNETQLNTLLFKIITLIMKFNSKVNRDDIISDRVFYLNYDLIELGVVTTYFMDVVGSKIILQSALSPSIFSILIEKFRNELSKGFSFDLTEDKKFYIVEGNLKSPKIAQVILLQLQKIKKEKPIAIKIKNELLTSRFFMDGKEGLKQVEV